MTLSFAKQTILLTLCCCSRVVLCQLISNHVSVVKKRTVNAICIICKTVASIVMSFYVPKQDTRVLVCGVNLFQEISYILDQVNVLN